MGTQKPFNQDASDEENAGCDGTWRFVSNFENDGKLVEVDRCDGCGEWTVILEYKGISVPAHQARYASQALIIATAEYVVWKAEAEA